MGLVKGRGAACLPLWGAAERSESEIHSIAGGNVSSFTVAARRADGRGVFRRKLVGSTDKCGTDENRSPFGAPLPPPGGGTLPKGEGKCLPLWGRWHGASRDGRGLLFAEGTKILNSQFRKVVFL